MASEWEAVLAGRVFAVFVVRGIREIFLDYRRSLGGKSPKNMRWANVTPDPINRYVRAELQQSSASPAQPPYECAGWALSQSHTSRGKWRLITDLSFPKGESVNDGIGSEVCSVSYATVDYAVRCIKTLGRGALLAKFDITNAYRVIPVHPTDRLLLGLPLRGDTLWTEPFISVSGRRRTASRQWLMPQSEGGMSFMPCTIWTISLYLAPLTPRNVAGRCRRLSRASWRDPRLSFLGILIDSENDTLSFPADKCARLKISQL